MTGIAFNDGGATPGVSYGYDDYGARTAMTDGEGTMSYSYNSYRQLQTETRTFTWDGANRLKSVNGTLSSYGYDGNGKRVKKAEGGTTTWYIYSSIIGAAVMEVTTAGVQRAYVMNGGTVVAQRNPDGQFYWLHTDHLGSGRKMTNTAGQVTYRAEFDPYGNLQLEWSATPNQNTKKFTGYERDAATGLDYAQARYYSAQWGRFMTPDPLSNKSSSFASPLSLNLYAYVGNNPSNAVDPSGLNMEHEDDSHPHDGPPNGSCGSGFMCPGVHYFYTFGGPDVGWQLNAWVVSGNGFSGSGSGGGQKQRPNPIDEGNLLEAILNDALKRMVEKKDCFNLLSNTSNGVRGNPLFMLSWLFQNDRIKIENLRTGLNSTVWGSFKDDIMTLRKQRFDALDESRRAANSMGLRVADLPGMQELFNKFVNTVLHETGHATSGIEHYSGTMDYYGKLINLKGGTKLLSENELDNQINSKCF